MKKKKTHAEGRDCPSRFPLSIAKGVRMIRVRRSMAVFLNHCAITLTKVSGSSTGEINDLIRFEEEEGKQQDMLHVDTKKARS